MTHGLELGGCNATRYSDWFFGGVARRSGRGAVAGLGLSRPLIVTGQAAIALRTNVSTVHGCALPIMRRLALGACLMALVEDPTDTCVECGLAVLRAGSDFRLYLSVWEGGQPDGGSQSPGIFPAFPPPPPPPSASIPAMCRDYQSARQIDKMWPRR